jgi:hypothetical protein
VYVPNTIKTDAIRLLAHGALTVERFLLDKNPAPTTGVVNPKLYDNSNAAPRAGEAEEETKANRDVNTGDEQGEATKADVIPAILSKVIEMLGENKAI